MSHATIESIQVGRARTVAHGKSEVQTGIFKDTVTGPVAADTLGLAGDEQADLRVHGGPYKAVYLFPSEHYPGWMERFPEAGLSAGGLGENLTANGILESDVAVGDRFECGSAILRVTMPRLPCAKLAMKLGDPLAVRHMLETRQTGFYFAVERRGEIRAGDQLVPLSRAEDRLTIPDFVGLYVDKTRTAEELRRAAEIDGMEENWVEWFLKRADKPGA